MRIIALGMLCLLFSQNIAAQWNSVNSGTLAWFHTIYFLDNDNGWIAGSSGTILKTGDGGRSWEKQKLKTCDTIREIHFFGPDNGWILCDRATQGAGRSAPSYILRTSNGGRDWESVEFPDSRERMTSLLFSGDRSVFAVGEGGIILSKRTGEAAWKRSPLPTRYLVEDGIFITPMNGFLIGGGGTMLITSDGGMSWNRGAFADAHDRPRLNAIYFADEKNGWTVGLNGAIYSTNDGGRLWHAQISQTSADLYDIAFLDPRRGFAVGESGTIVGTDDGGATWRREPSGVRHRLESVAVAGDRAFAVGFGGTIVMNLVKVPGN